MCLSWKSLLTCKYYGEISSNSVWTAPKNPPYIFFKMRNSLFSFRSDKLKPKQLRLPFSRKFFRISSGTYLTQQKKYCGNRCELSNWSWAAVTWQWSSLHLLSLRRFLSLPPRLATPLEKKVCCLGGRTRTSLCLQKKNRRPRRSNGSRSGASALIFPLCHCREPVLSHARCQTLKSRI